MRIKEEWNSGVMGFGNSGGIFQNVMNSLKNTKLLFQYSIIPPFHYSIIPSFQDFTIPVFHTSLSFFLFIRNGTSGKMSIPEITHLRKLRLAALLNIRAPWMEGTPLGFIGGVRNGAWD